MLRVHCRRLTKTETAERRISYSDDRVASLTTPSCIRFSTKFAYCSHDFRYQVRRAVYAVAIIMIIVNSNNIIIMIFPLRRIRSECGQSRSREPKFRFHHLQTRNLAVITAPL